MYYIPSYHITSPLDLESTHSVLPSSSSLQEPKTHPFNPPIYPYQPTINTPIHTLTIFIPPLLPCSTILPNSLPIISNHLRRHEPNASDPLPTSNFPSSTASHALLFRFQNGTIVPRTRAACSTLFITPFSSFFRIGIMRVPHHHHHLITNEFLQPSTRPAWLI